MENGRFEKYALIVIDKTTPANSRQRNLLSISLVKKHSIEQLPRGHAFLPIVQDYISSGIAIRQDHGGMVGTHAIARVAVDACAKRPDFTSLEVYLETFDVRGFAIVPEEVSYVFFLVAVYACYLLAAILVPEQWLRYASAKRNQVWLIILVTQLVNHDQDLAKFGENVEVVAGHYVRIDQREATGEHGLRYASIAGYGIQAKDAG